MDEGGTVGDAQHRCQLPRLSDGVIQQGPHPRQLARRDGCARVFREQPCRPQYQVGHRHQPNLLVWMSRRVSWTARGTAASVLRVSLSMPPVPSTITPSGSMRSQSCGSSDAVAVSIVSGRSLRSQVPTGPGAGARGREQIHSAALRPAAAAAARASSSPSHGSYGTTSSVGPAGRARSSRRANRLASSQVTVRPPSPPGRGRAAGCGDRSPSTAPFRGGSRIVCLRRRRSRRCGILRSSGTGWRGRACRSGSRCLPRWWGQGG